MAPLQKVILVTGASRGIGACVANHLARAGHKVFGTSRALSLGLTPNYAMELLDIQNTDSVTRCVDSVLQRAGRIDVLVNNAGFDLYGALEETSLEEFQNQLDTNFMGSVRMIKAVLPHLRKQGGGQIINMSSLGGRIGLPMNSAYAASKFALEGFSESLRLEMLPHKVFVSLVVPGAVATDTLDTSIREITEPVGPYALRRANLVKQMRQEGAKSSTKPLDVALAVQKLINSDAPPLSRSVGAQAKWVPRMKAMLPQQSFERVLRKLFP